MKRRIKRRIKRFITFIVTAVIAIISTLPVNVVSVSAATANPQSLEELFDADFYAYKYPEVANAVGNDEKALFNHFVQHGINEGETCSPYLNVAQYRAYYTDVAQAFDHHWDDIVNHYFTNGIKEGRNSFVSPEDIAIKNALSQQNNSVILDSIENAILDATNSSTGYAKDSKTGIIASDNGYALVPFEIVQKEGRIQDIDELAKRCGDDLVLIRDSYNRIKFVGGRFSNVVVKDEESALEAIDTMVDLYHFDTNRNYMKLSSKGTDSLGNPFYRFVSVDEEDGAVNSDYTVTLSADKDGNVLGVSNANSSSLERKSAILDAPEKWGNGMDEFYNDPENGYIKLYDEPKLLYNDETKKYYWAYYYESAGLIYEVLVDPEKTETVEFTRYYDADTYRNNPAQSFNGDYQFKNLFTLTEKSFVDFYGNEVKLPVAYEEGKGWYIVDTERNMICVESSKDDNIQDITQCSRHFFADEYFDAVNEYLKGDSDTNPLLENEKTIISAFTTIQMSYDENRALGMLEKPKTIYVNYIYDDTRDNASQTTYNDAIEFTVNNNIGNADFAGMAHEFGHAVVANQGQNIPYRAATGAINESYADIIGNLIKMIKKKEGQYSGNVDFERWLIGEFLGNDTEHVIRNMSNPLLNQEGPSPIQVNDEYFIKDTGVYTNGSEGIVDKDGEISNNDRGGVHQNNSILSHICYRMYNEVFADKDDNGNGIPDENKYRDLLKVWYDSVIYLNHDSTYADVKGYIIQSMKNHGYSNEALEQTEEIFNDAKVDDYKPFDKSITQAQNYDSEDLATAAKVGANVGGFTELGNLIDGGIKADNARFDYEIAYDELQLAKLNGVTGNELKEYENNLEIAYNALTLSENNVDELKSAFSESQTRIKSIVDSKKEIINRQERALKKLAKEKESNPNLTSAYRALRRGLKDNVSKVDKISNAIEDAVTEFKDYDDIMDVFSDVWDINIDDWMDDNDSEDQDEMSEDSYFSEEFSPDDSWEDFWGDFWDDFWDDFWEDDYDDYDDYDDWDDWGDYDDSDDWDDWDDWDDYEDYDDWDDDYDDDYDDYSDSSDSSSYDDDDDAVG